MLHKILIIEDEGDISLLLNIMLKTDDVQIDHVNSIAAAKAFLLEQQVDTVILDNQLPDGLGVDYIATIKATYPASKIIMITGHSTAADKQKALDNGATIFITKPFTKEQILTAIKPA